MEAEKKMRVCVTGAGGFQASWLVNLLLSKGYMVHGTVRDPSSEKNAHLKKLEKAIENLQLFKVDLLDYDSLCAAIAGCDGVFHVASPVPSGSVSNPEVELLEPAINGTLNVLKASSVAKVKRVVCVSSGAAVALSPSWPKDRVMDENCWSDKEYCRASENWYCLSKTVAESEALEFGEKYGLNVVTLCPTLILGPMLQPVMNASSMFLYKILIGANETMENTLRVLVDVRDVAEALLLIYEKPETSGRYICAPHPVRISELVDKLRSLYPNYNYPKKFTDVDSRMKLSSEKLMKLGWKCRPLEETLADAVMCMEEAGLLKKD